MNKYGTDALTDLAERMHFPIMKSKLVEEHGEEMVEIVEGHPVRLWMLLANCPERRFESREDFITCPAIMEAVRTEEEAA